MGASAKPLRKLQQKVRCLVARVERGEAVDVTHHGRRVARLAPVKPSGSNAIWPDLEARTRSVFGARVISPGGADVVIDDRGRR